MKTSKTEWIFKDDIKRVFEKYERILNEDYYYCNQETTDYRNPKRPLKPFKYKITIEIKRVK